MTKIAIDTGHGINTAGKQVPISMGYGKISEWELNDRITRKQIELLNKYEGVEIIRLDDPTGKVDIPLTTRTNKANQFKADLLISNHHNLGIKGGKGGGLALYRYPNSSKFTAAMQKALYDSLIKAGAVKGNRATPLAQANFHMVRESKMAAILPEYAFMDSPNDMKEIMKPDFADKMAKGVVDWVVSHYKLKLKPTTAPTTLPKVQKQIAVELNGTRVNDVGYLIDNRTYISAILASNIAGAKIEGKGDYVKITK